MVYVLMHRGYAEEGGEKVIGVTSSRSEAVKHVMDDPEVCVAMDFADRTGGTGRMDHIGDLDEDTISPLSDAELQHLSAGWDDRAKEKVVAYITERDRKCAIARERAEKQAIFTAEQADRVRNQVTFISLHISRINPPLGSHMLHDLPRSRRRDLVKTIHNAANGERPTHVGDYCVVMGGQRYEISFPEPLFCPCDACYTTRRRAFRISHMTGASGYFLLQDPVSNLDCWFE